MAKILSIIIFALAALTVAIFQHAQKSTKTDALEKAQNRGQMRWYVDVAKARGEQEITFTSSKLHYSVPSSLERALATQDLVVAEVIDSKSYAADSDRDIETWYKFRIVETLSTHTEACSTCPVLSPPPATMLPVNPGEFLISRIGGEVSMDGVRVVSYDSDFPPFENGKRYLLFLAFDSQQLVAGLRMGPWGTFAVGRDEKLRPVNDKMKHNLRSQLAQDFDDSVVNLRSNLKKGH